MANENVGRVAKGELKKEVSFRRRKYEIKNEDGTVSVGEYLECSATVAGETVRFKADPASSKMVRVLMKIHGFPLFDVDGVSVVKEDAVVDL